MTIERKILLARPHAFIVAEMKPMLVHAGFSPSPLSALSDLAGGAWNAACGALISTAVSSTIPESADIVFATLRRQAPRMPIVFAGLTEFDVARRNIERIVQTLSPQAAILQINAGNLRHAGLGRPDVFLYIQKENLKTPEGLALTERMLQRHFG